MNIRSKDAKCHCSSNSLSLISSSSFNNSTVRLVEWRSISDTPTNKGLLSSMTQPKGDIDVSQLVNANKASIVLSGEIPDGK